MNAPTISPEKRSLIAFLAVILLYKLYSFSESIPFYGLLMYACLVCGGGEDVRWVGQLARLTTLLSCASKGLPTEVASFR